MPPLSDALQEAPGSLGTVRNAALLLQLLAEGPAFQQLTDLADRSGLSLATVHRLLRSLVLADLVEQDPQSSRYGLGPELTRLSHRRLARLPVLGALAPYLGQVRDAVGGTVRVDVVVRTAVVSIDRIDGSGAGVGLYRDPHGPRLALDTVAGRLLLSRADDERWKQALAEVDEPTRALAEHERDDWAKAPAPARRCRATAGRSGWRARAAAGRDRAVRLRRRRAGRRAGIRGCAAPST